jgi:adenine-specific DNA-methyltransferase
MKSIMAIEEERLSLQSRLDAEKSAALRNQLGQYATPTDLASTLLSYAYQQMPRDGQVRFLDPAIGTGSFYSALLREFDDRTIATAVGYEVDPHYGIPARSLWSNYPVAINLADFTATSPPLPAQRFNLVICNPPYVRHHHLPKSLKSTLAAAATASCGIKLSGLSGLYCYFLGIAHAWMADDALAGWLIPSEFMDVNYGTKIKQYLLEVVDLIRIHQFNPSELQFSDAQVSSAVVWFRKRPPTATHLVEFSYGGTLATPEHSRLLPAATVQASAKWSQLAIAGVRCITKEQRLGDFFEIKRGIATGANDFFIVNPKQLAEHHLPRSLFRPILPSPRYLTNDIIDSNPDGTPKINQQLFVLDCRLNERELLAQHPALFEYLKTGLSTAAKTYLCSRRTPWYAQEIRPPAPFLCSYMGRNLSNRQKPFRFILNYSHATAANVYLMLYPKPLLTAALTAHPSLYRQVWEFLNSIDGATLISEGRVYGGGLYKLEPKELANVPAMALASLLASGTTAAQEISPLLKRI